MQDVAGSSDDTARTCAYLTRAACQRNVLVLRNNACIPRICMHEVHISTGCVRPHSTQQCEAQSDDRRERHIPDGSTRRVPRARSMGGGVVQRGHVHAKPYISCRWCWRSRRGSSRSRYEMVSSSPSARGTTLRTHTVTASFSAARGHYAGCADQPYLSLETARWGRDTWCSWARTSG